MTLAPDDLTAIGALLDKALAPVLARLQTLEHTVLRLEKRVGDLDARVRQMRTRVDRLSADILTGRTRDVETLADLELRVDALEDLVRQPQLPLPPGP